MKIQRGKGVQDIVKTAVEMKVHAVEAVHRCVFLYIYKTITILYSVMQCIILYNILLILLQLYYT